ncbi:MAG TPA: hypothetical protein PKD90_14115 [Phnomibacter sp.]|nr:hypothetical protein [Phnomibacter sp.]
MRKLLVIALLGLHLVTTTEAYQLLKLPALVWHYVEHIRQDAELGLPEFLLMHYAEAQTFDADWQQDMQLPFKHHEDLFSQMPVLQGPPAAVFNLTWVLQPDYLLHRAKPLVSFVAHAFLVDIFQPPRVCISAA